jgi:hypothetical protein
VGVRASILLLVSAAVKEGYKEAELWALKPSLPTLGLTLLARAVSTLAFRT